MLDAAFARRDHLIADLDGRGARYAPSAARSDAAGSEDGVASARSRAARARLRALRDAEDNLVFGRIDTTGGVTYHIGTVGLSAPDDSERPLVLDWRAPAARPFYTATAVDPAGLDRRRHISTRGRAVVAVADEPLRETPSSDLVGEGALLAALAANRTGHMSSAVATLQREQDEVVRADPHLPLVVQGGPGTGKTVVALHRVAYLLFAHPELAARGVLLLGPSRRFLDYINRVLPALGETAVVSTTWGSLVPGVTAEREESRSVAEVKGRAEWQATINAHVAALYPSPEDLVIAMDGERYVVPAGLVGRLLAAAVRPGRSYAAARRTFTGMVADALTELVVERQATLLADVERGLEDVLERLDSSLALTDDRAPESGAVGSDVDGRWDEHEIEALRVSVATDRGLHLAVHTFWPDTDPEAERIRLLGDADLLARHAPWLSEQERALVVAEPTSVAPSDLPLLDALAELLEDDLEPATDSEFRADRAAARRDWVYGHVVVDEAQELSQMQWLMVRRRCPGASLTAVGDIDQSEAPHRHRTWAEALEPVLGHRWRRADLTICYRTPREVMDLTAPVLAAAGSTNRPPRAVRSSGTAPWLVETPEAGVDDAVVAAAAELARRWADGTVGVVAPDGRVDALGDALAAAGIRAPVLNPSQAKGLEWDAALVVDPDGIAAGARGHHRLYVALTRCAQELGRIVVRD